MSAFVGVTHYQNPFLSFDPLLSQHIDAHLEDNLEHMNCEVCNALNEATNLIREDYSEPLILMVVAGGYLLDTRMSEICVEFAAELIEFIS